MPVGFWDFCQSVGYLPSIVAQSPVPIGEIFANKYRVERVLGEGGMGVVVAAHHLELDQPVAIKFLLDEVADQAEGAERFRREARAAAKIHSDHVVRVLDVGVMESGVRYMVMEYLEGRDLAEEIAERKTFSPGVVAGFILEAIDAVGQAHNVGIVHRDLKPANLFLAQRPDASYRIKVLDFGISKSVGGATSEQLSLTKTSAWIGSPLYMAPEQMQSARDVDARADIWSLGAIMYELLAGEPPYVADSLPQLCNMLITQDPVHIQERCSEVPDGLAQAVMACLVRDREQRTQTTAELAQVLVQYATTITGSGMRTSLLDQTEVGNSVPASVMAASYRGPLSSSSNAVEGTSGVKTATAGSPISDGTHAAWGATDNGHRQQGGRIALLVLGLAAAAGAGFYFASTGGSEAPEDVPLVATQVEPNEKDVPAPTPEPEAVKKEEPPAASQAEQEKQKAEEVAPTPAVTPPAPRPVVRPRPAPSPAPVVAPKPAPAPTPAPATETKDDFADFGGRR